MSTSIDMKHVDKGWGYERWIVNCKQYCGKLLFFNRGKRCSWHYHKIKDEVFYLQSGKLMVYYSDDDDINTGSGLIKHFKITKQGIYTPIEPNVLNNLDEYAPKINTILNHILEMGDNGIAFVFSQFVSSGIVPMILALESKGFSKYDGFNSKFHHLKIP